MRIAITGASGNVGTALLRSLGNDPDASEIVGVVRRMPAWSPPKTIWHLADVATDDLDAAFRGVDAVVHLAWLFQPTRNVVTTWQANVVGSIRTFEAAVRAGARTVVHASSIATYAPRIDLRPVDESWPTHALPTAAYGWQKSYVERVLDAMEVRHPDVRFVRVRSAFVFQRSAAHEQRRLFLGPFVPQPFLRPGVLPVLPLPASLVMQAVHADDVARAYRAALHRPVRGAFNIAADPVLDAADVARLMRARLLPVPDRLVRHGMALAWHLRAVPAEPGLLELALSLPVMSTERARRDLGWTPSTTAGDAVREFIEGSQQPHGGLTPPLQATASGRFRWREIATGVGQRDR